MPEAGRPAVRGAVPTLARARVTAAFGRHFVVEDDAGRVWRAVRRGKRGDVAVGDEVEISTDGTEQAVIERVLPRASVLMRADGLREKTLAANIDQVAVVFAAQPPFNQEFIWRALLAAHGADIAGVAILNKADLPQPQEAQAALALLRKLGVPTLTVSAQADPDGARARLLTRLQGHRTLLVGQSGMGKSTLLNLLVPDANARTQEFSRRLNLGRQTTTASRWFWLPGGGALVDSPGFQSFGLSHLDLATIAAGFPEFAPYLGRCRFNDCRHLEEPGCSVREALASGAIDAARYAFYRSLVQERA